MEGFGYLVLAIIILLLVCTVVYLGISINDSQNDIENHKRIIRNYESQLNDDNNNINNLILKEDELKNEERIHDENNIYMLNIREQNEMQNLKTNNNRYILSEEDKQLNNLRKIQKLQQNIYTELKPQQILVEQQLQGVQKEIQKPN